MESNGVSKWYDYVVDAGGVVRGRSMRRPINLYAYMLGGPTSIRASVSPLVIPGPCGDPQILWKWVQHQVFPDGKTFFVLCPGPLPMWDPKEKPEFAEIIREARQYPDAVWGSCTMDSQGQDVYELIPTPEGFPCAGHLQKIICHPSRQVFVGVVIPVTMQVDVACDMLEVEFLLEYRQIFPSTIDKSCYNVLGSTITFNGFVL